MLAQEQLDLGVSAGQAGERPRIAFLFAGQGGQYPGMGRQLYDAQPVFRAAIDRCAASIRRRLQRPLLEVMFADAADDATIHETQYTQPALFAVEYAMAELWRSWGIEPAAVIGHSMGEYAAACVAGAISLEERCRSLPNVRVSPTRRRARARWRRCSRPKRSSRGPSPTSPTGWRSRQSTAPNTS